MSATIHYHDIGDYLSREEKLKIIDDFGDIAAVPWQTIAPDKHGDWLNKRDSEFDDYIPLAPNEKFDYLAKSWFTVNSSGLKTGMDAEAINYSADTTVAAIKAKTGFSDPARLREYSYRPFHKQWLYYDREVNQRQYRIPAIFPVGKYPNKVICVTGAGGSKEFSCIITDCIPDLHFCGDVQAFPLYWYEEIKTDTSVMELPGLEKQSGYIKHDAISDFILQEFRKIAGPRVQKEDIFNYVYGALHNPDYRAKFAADLKKQLPRLPLPKNRREFEKVESIGRKLANLHLHYEEIDPWPLGEIAAGKIDYRVEKMSWAKDGKTVRKDMLVVNPSLTLAGIPKEAHEYLVNGRTPLEWLIDRYQVRTDADSGIVNDPNKWGEEHDYPQYIVELVKRLVRLSVETVELVGKLGGSRSCATADARERVPPAAHPSATPPYWWKSGVWGVESPMPEGGNVVMGLKQKWYDKIEAGLKHDEFRQMKPYWDERLGGRKGRELRSVTFMRGQASPVQMTWEVLGVETATTPGHAGYYVIHLGKRIK
ncbi:MAG: hypothetical protein J6P13_01095 [Kiritimatiellae bacterium]|nr:hypothetical protein [Kiritimatiellia bacterium]